MTATTGERADSAAADEAANETTWARSQWGLAAGASVGGAPSGDPSGDPSGLDDASLGVVLAGLEDLDFMPPPDSREALDVLTGRGSQAPAFRRQREADCAAAVGRFVAEFFTLPVEQRRRRWDELFDQSDALPGRVRGQLRPPAAAGGTRPRRRGRGPAAVLAIAAAAGAR